MVLLNFFKQIQNEKGLSIITIKSDHGSKFENENFQVFHENHCINHNISTPKTPQQNVVVKRKKNRYL